MARLRIRSKQINPQKEALLLVFKDTYKSFSNTDAQTYTVAIYSLAAQALAFRVSICIAAGKQFERWAVAAGVLVYLLLLFFSNFLPLTTHHTSRRVTRPFPFLPFYSKAFFGCVLSVNLDTSLRACAIYAETTVSGGGNAIWRFARRQLMRSCCGLGQVRLRMLRSKLEASEAQLKKSAMVQFALAR